MDNKTFFNILKWLIIIGLVFFLVVFMIVTIVMLPNILYYILTLIFIIMQKCKFLSKTDINNFNDPYYCVVLEDGPSHSSNAIDGSYESSSSILYFSPSAMPAFYKTLPFLARYYKVSIRIIGDPNPSPF